MSGCPKGQNVYKADLRYSCVKDSERSCVGDLHVFMEMHEDKCVLLVLSRRIWKEILPSEMILGIPIFCEYLW